MSCTPPKMLPFLDYPSCHVCKTKFAFLKRACHCRNCGVCVCKDCTLLWPGKMLPETYNFKRESSVNICKSCDWLCSEFRLALLAGDYDHALALYATGNINVYNPFANVKGELFYPIHCAVIGGNLKLLTFLVDEKFCPINFIRVTKDPRTKYTPIVTSKGRTLLNIALGTGNIPITRYLVVDKAMPIMGEKDLSTEILCRNLTLCLRQMTNEADPNRMATDDNKNALSANVDSQQFPCLSPAQPSSSEPWNEFYFHDDAHALLEHDIAEQIQKDLTVDDKGDNQDAECIICFDRTIDCVTTPCGHQICCLVCSEQISRCPVCNVDCSFMRIYKS